MPKSLSTYRVFIASPGGLDAERTAFREVIREFNDMCALDRGIAFHPLGWEDTLPGKGRPQSLINEDVRDSDFMVLLLWDRWGTPPGGDGEYTSGTEEEFTIAQAAIKDQSLPMRQIVVLFKNVELRQLSDPGEQLRKVLDFRKRLETEKEFLYGTFDNSEAFAKLIQKQLWSWLSELERAHDGLIGDDNRKPPPPGGGPMSPLVPIDPDELSAIDQEAISISKMVGYVVVEQKEPIPEVTEPASQTGDDLSVVEEAQRLADEGRLTEAEVKFASAILRGPNPKALIAYGRYLARVGRLDQGLLMFTEAERVSRATNDQASLSDALRNLGMILMTRGDLDEAETMNRTALAIDKKLGRLEGMADSYRNLGIFIKARGDLDGAETAYRRALEINKKLARREGIAICYGNLGNIMRARRDLEAAEGMYRESLEISENLGRPDQIASGYGSLGNIMLDRGDLDGAEAMYRKALEIDEKLGRRDAIALGYGEIGNVMYVKGDTRAAEAMYRKALEIDEQIGRLRGMAADYGNLGNVLKRRGDLDGAERMYRKSLEISEAKGLIDLSANQYKNLGRLLRERGDERSARDMFIRSRDLYAKARNQRMVEMLQDYIGGRVRSTSSSRHRERGDGGA